MTTIRYILTCCGTLLIAGLPCRVGAESVTLASRLQGLSPLAMHGAQIGHVGLRGGRPPAGATTFGQRAIDDDTQKPEPKPDDDEPGEPIPPDELGVDTMEERAPSPVNALLLSAALPGLGQLYAGSNTGYAFLGLEAVTWITWASFRSTANSKEDEMFAFADRNFSMDLFDRNCVSQDGQSCAQASDAVRDFWENDRAEYYEIISKNTIYKSGWGVIAFENSEPPEFGTEEYRAWIADLSRDQDNDFIEYNTIRDERNDASRTSRGMMVVTLLNRVVSAWHAFWLAGGLQPPDVNEFKIRFDVEPSFAHPGAKVLVSRKF